MNIVGLAGWSGAGKTTLITRLIPLLTARGLSVSTIKHAHHGFDIDRPGKDSYLHRQAGAREVLVASDRRWALLHELPEATPPDLRALLARLTPCDLVIVEGFRSEVLSKIEVHRAANGKPFLFDKDGGIVALVSDAKPPGCALPFAHLDAVEAIADLVVACAKPSSPKI